MAQRPELSEAEREALDRLVSPADQTGDVRADLIAAAQEAWRRREQNSDDGGSVLNALHRDAGSWTTVAYVTGIPRTTAFRWAAPPPEVAADLADTPAEDD